MNKYEVVESTAKFSNEEGNEFLEITVMCREIPSVNSMYAINYKTKAKYLAPMTVAFKNAVADQIAKVDPVKNCDWLKGGADYAIYYEFLINHSYNKRDVDNMIKSTQDIFCKTLGKFDDNRIHEIWAAKGYVKDPNHEYVRIRLTKSKYDKFKYCRQNDKSE